MSDDSTSVQTNSAPSTVDTQLERRKTLSELVKNCVEIVALVVGGVWVALTFGLKECPAREPHFESTAKLTWYDDSDPTRCYAGWQVALKNISSRRIDVGYVEVAAWSFVPPAPTEKPAYLDFQRLRPTDQKLFLFARSFEASTAPNSAEPFVDHYAPGSTSSHTFEWIFKKPSQEQWVGMELALFRSRGDEQALWYIYDWSPICDEDNSSAPSIGTPGGLSTK